ncbi:hypothetical protein C8Q80DRAFT_1138104 [Daedaleopsis nitida]|nr:hypothetical protein C8Q80DRAFT_1138104 [Daedaleopsis nitida]
MGHGTYWDVIIFIAMLMVSPPSSESSSGTDSLLDFSAIYVRAHDPDSVRLACPRTPNPPSPYTRLLRSRFCRSLSPISLHISHREARAAALSCS